MRILLAAICILLLLSVCGSSVQAVDECDVTVQPEDNVQAKIDQTSESKTICFRPGTYTQNSVTVNEDHITLIGQGEVIFDGKNDYPQPSTNDNGEPTPKPLLLLQGDYITLKGLILKNSLGTGLVIKGNNAIISNVIIDYTKNQALNVNGSGHTLTKIKVYRGNDNWGMRRDKNGNIMERYTGANVAIRATNVTLTDCEVAYGFNDPLGITIAENITIKNCLLYDNKATGLYIDNAKNVLVEGNLIFRTTQAKDGAFRTGSKAISINQEKYTFKTVVTQDITVVNNVIVNYDNGILLRAGTDMDANGNIVPTEGGFKNIKIAHNTFVNQTGNFLSANSLEQNNANHTPSEFINNLVIGENPSIFASNEGALDKFTFAHNFYTSSPYEGNIPKVQGEGDIIDDSPELTNPNIILTDPSKMNSDNYKLTSLSPAIDKGIPLDYVPTDYFGAVRPFGNLPDIGFHEYGGSPGPSITPSADHLECRQQACTLVSGFGTNSCTTHADCITPTQPISITPTSLPWDLNTDGVVDVFDFSKLVTGFQDPYDIVDLFSFLSAL